MPVNAGPEYFSAEKKYHEARTKEEKIEAIEEMIRTLPKHKGVHNILAQLRKKLSDLKKEAAKKASVKKPKFSIKKEGYAQICIVGLTNSGKSTLLKSLTGVDVKIADYPFTTKIPVVAMMEYKNVPLQIIEIPSNFNREHLSLMKNSDLLLVAVDFFHHQSQTKELEKIFDDNRLAGKKKIWITTKSQEINFDELKGKIWKELNLIHVYTKSPGKFKQLPAIGLRPGSTVRDVARIIHKDFLKSFRFARIFNSTRFSGQQVGLEYKLHDEDVVEIHTQ